VAGPRKKNGESQRFSVRFSSLEGFLVYRGEFTLISPVGLVKAFLMLMRGKGWRPFLARKGEQCMNDTVHAAVHRSVHLFGEGKFYGALRLRFTRPLILDQGPPTGSRQQKKACCAAVSSEKSEGASEEGKNCSLPFCASLISSPNDAGSCQKRRWMRGITNGKVTGKKRLNRAGATPLFGGPSAQKGRGIAPARHAGSVTV
jgi:hypothetical protein